MPNFWRIIFMTAPEKDIEFTSNWAKRDFTV